MMDRQSALGRAGLPDRPGRTWPQVMKQSEKTATGRALTTSVSVTWHGIAAGERTEMPEKFNLGMA
ncbi:hypothetical protein C6W92_17040 [Roseovarius sp. A46]|nr:hypothetical protein C6W92_17040 [Roseovarius sp. A46]